MNPLDIIEKGLKINPQLTKILFGGVILAACFALVALLLGKEWQNAFVGLVLFIIAAVVLVVIEAIAASARLRSTGLWFARFSVCLVAVVTLVLFSSWAFEWPKPLHCLVNPLNLSCKSVVPSHQRRAVCLDHGKKLQNGSCRQADGNFVVVGIRSDDADHGLNVRDKPGLRGIIRYVLPPHGTDLVVGPCEAKPDGSDIWCPVRCGSVSGWSSDRYLRRRSSTLHSIIGVNPTGPGLAIRNGPNRTCSTVGSVPPNSRDVICHICEINSKDNSNWCLITYNSSSGWVPGENLQPQPNES